MVLLGGIAVLKLSYIGKPNASTVRCLVMVQGYKLLVEVIFYLKLAMF